MKTLGYVSFQYFISEHSISEMYKSQNDIGHFPSLENIPIHNT